MKINKFSIYIIVALLSFSYVIQTIDTNTSIINNNSSNTTNINNSTNTTNSINTSNSTNTTNTTNITDITNTTDIPVIDPNSQGNTSNIYRCLNETYSSNSYARGDLIYICVHFLNTTNILQQYRTAYQIVVDEYSAIVNSGSFENLNDNINSFNISIQPAASNTSSFQYYIYINSSLNQNRVYPFYSIMITFDQGIVTGTQWDNVCFSTDECAQYSDEQNQYINPLNQCQLIDSNCDPIVYVSFLGTDKNGGQMTSASMRMSRFRQFAVSNYFNTALSTFQSTYQSTINSTTS